MLNDPVLYPSLSVNPLAQPNPALPAATLPGLEGLGGVSSASSTRTEGGLLKPVGLPTVNPDLNNQVVNRWNPLYTPPTITTPAPRPQDAPLKVQAPRRSF